MKKKLFMSFVGIAIISFAAYNSFQNQEEEFVLSEMALENAEALAQNINPECPDGCLEDPGYCYCYGDHDVESYNWGDDNKIPEIPEN